MGILFILYTYFMLLFNYFIQYIQIKRFLVVGYKAQNKMKLSVANWNKKKYGVTL